VPAISVGSVEVDVLPNATGVRNRLQAQLLPAANSVGDEVGRVIGRYLTAHVAAGFVQGIQNGGRQAQPAAARQGASTGSTFARSFKTRLEAALANLPEVRLHANSTDAEREIYQIRAQLTALRDVRIGIDVSSTDANAAIAHMQERLARLSASDADVAVRVDAGAAAAQLAAFQAEVNRLDGQTADVDVDTRSASANLNLLTTAALAFGPAILPVLPVVAAGLGAIAAAGVAAAAGIGSIALVAVPAFKGIGSALQAQKAAQDAATNSTYQGGKASSQAASQARQMESAQQSLATARRNSARQIADAERAVGDAVRQAAQANARAAAQVKQARQSLADAYTQAADRMRQANQQVVQAERDLALAQKSSRQAQLDLTAARVEASRQLQDMNNQLTDSKLSERDAEIALAEATAARDRVLQNANATELDKQKALLQYDQAVQRLKEQQLETKRLTADTAAANKAGVEGSDTVKSAQERLASAQQDVVDKTTALKAAQADVAKTQIANTRAIADAQVKLSEAQKNVAETQRQGAESIARAQERVVQAQQSGADSIASAQRQIESASTSAAGGMDQAAIAQAKYRAELAKLTPSARDTFNAFLDLRTAFGAWSKSLQPAVMPIFTRALVSLRKTLPSLTPFVKGAADAIKELQDRASKSVKSPFWQGFKKDLQGSVKPAIVGLGVAIGNLIKGMAGVIDAFLPHMDGISSRMQKITKRFADWGAKLKGSPEFERFLTFASEKAPILGSALGKIALAFLNVGQALSPISGPLLQMLGGAANFIAIIADKAPWMIQAIYGIIVAIKLWTIAQGIFNFVMNQNPLVRIALLIGVLIAAVIYAYNKFGWFRAGVDAVWAALKAGGKAVVDWFTGPFKNFFTKTIPAIFQTTLNWVKRNWPWILGALGGPIGLAVVYIIKHWDDLKRGLANGWGAIKRTVIYPIRDFFTKTIPGWGNTLRDKMVGAFDAARKGIKNAWDKIKAIAKAPVQYVVDVVYNNGIRGVWNKIAGAFGAPKLPHYTFASGGIMPGYTPGKDVHKFISPTGGALELSGGEAIMRPEFTRAVGSGFVNTLNSIASSRGAQGVKAALAPVFGGSAPMSTDHSSRYAAGGIVQKFADGGIFGWIKSAGSAHQRRWLGRLERHQEGRLLAGRHPGGLGARGRQARRRPAARQVPRHGHRDRQDDPPHPRQDHRRSVRLQQEGRRQGRRRDRRTEDRRRSEVGEDPGRQEVPVGRQRQPLVGLLGLHVRDRVRHPRPEATPQVGDRRVLGQDGTARLGLPRQQRLQDRHHQRRCRTHRGNPRQDQRRIPRRCGCPRRLPGPRLQGQPVPELVRVQARHLRLRRLHPARPQPRQQRHRQAGAGVHDGAGQRPDIDGCAGRHGWSVVLRRQPLPRLRRVPRPGPRRGVGRHAGGPAGPDLGTQRELRRLPCRSLGTSSVRPPSPSTRTPPGGRPSSTARSPRAPAAVTATAALSSSRWRRGRCRPAPSPRTRSPRARSIRRSPTRPALSRSGSGSAG
jgi:hypothetical protein